MPRPAKAWHGKGSLGVRYGQSVTRLQYGCPSRRSVLDCKPSVVDVPRASSSGPKGSQDTQRQPRQRFRIESDMMPSRLCLRRTPGQAQDAIQPVSLPRENHHHDAKGSASGRLGVDGQEPLPPLPASFCALNSLLLASPPSD